MSASKLICQPNLISNNKFFQTIKSVIAIMPVKQSFSISLMMKSECLPRHDVCCKDIYVFNGSSNKIAFRCIGVFIHFMNISITRIWLRRLGNGPTDTLHFLLIQLTDWSEKPWGKTRGKAIPESVH